jgi:hydrogenase expression/formation protein HypE
LKHCDARTDRVFINTAGIGIIESPVQISAARAQVGDRVILSGTVGDHGTTIMIARGELELETNIRSDTALPTPWSRA